MKARKPGPPARLGGPQRVVRRRRGGGRPTRSGSGSLPGRLQMLSVVTGSDAPPPHWGRRRKDVKGLAQVHRAPVFAPACRCPIVAVRRPRCLNQFRTTLVISLIHLRAPVPRWTLEAITEGIGGRAPGSGREAARRTRVPAAMNPIIRTRAHRIRGSGGSRRVKSRPPRGVPVTSPTALG